MAIPNNPAKLLATRIATHIIIAGTAVDSIEMARPCITLVACPVSEALATDLTGLKLVDV